MDRCLPGRPDIKVFLERNGRGKNALFILGGAALYALALDLFLVGNNIAAEGISGLTIVLPHFFP